ncbi:hypothetical protein ElyMa_000368300 [Elysia marginata]|uniref:Apple domain-containing protein n=1 Tax=Elysia marginata TaxID=1093978 RepID=A0AAV4FFD1_9GAST|nr:hypothetical protein ElyMa_000368300 [Elysia marginata]
MDDFRESSLHADILKMRHKEFMSLGTRTVEETFRMCLWQGQAINCSQYISQVFTEAQMCYQFNGQLSGGKMVIRPGYSGGFQAVFTINVAGHTNSVNSDSGYRLILHDDPRHMHFSASTLLLSPGFLHHISLQKHTVGVHTASPRNSPTFT